MQTRKNNIATTALAVIFILSLILSCGKAIKAPPGSRSQSSPFTSYRNIPGVTAEETAAIEAFKAEGRSFSYGSLKSMEAFILQNGSTDGFSHLFCELLSEIFDIPFINEIREWDVIKSRLDNMSLDFAGDITPTTERRKIYFMTHPIAERSLRIFTQEYDDRFHVEEDINNMRLGSYRGSITAQFIMDAYPDLHFEIVDMTDASDVAASLAGGTIDLFIGDATSSVEYENYPSVHSKEFFPLVYTPVSMTTANPELKPIISVVNKYLEAGGIDKLFELYKEGRRKYAKYELEKSFTEEENAYIANLAASGSKVPIALENGNYPVSFYNKNDKEFQGIALEILSEITAMTGIEFYLATNENTSWSKTLDMLNTNEVALVSQLLHTPDRDGKYLWSNNYSSSHYALLSKANFPFLEMYQVVRTKVGVFRNSAYEEMYNVWFPNNNNSICYDTAMEGIHALESGKIDLLMASENMLITITHYLEMPEYKVNILFNMLEDSRFGFNINEEVLCSIFHKTQYFIDSDKISVFWTGRIFDYSRKLVQAQRPWFIGATALSLLTLALILTLFYRNRSEGKRLEKLVAKQTATLTAASEKAIKNSEAKSRFVANMNHEMRTPMNVIVGLTDLMLEEHNILDKDKEMLRKISTASNTLMGLINDVLDISKIEAGKFDLNPEQYDVAELLNDIIMINMVRIGDKPITFKLDISDNLPSGLFGDDLRIKQIVNNLLSNALKYTKMGFVTFGFNCRREGDDVWTSFYVSDTGIGIREEDIEKLFTDYYQVNTKANRKIEGTGLGLSITKKFVELMDGEISVESEYGKGTTFRVRIRQGFVTDKPIGRETAENLQSLRYTDKKKQMPEKLVRTNLSYARVLVVDDFPPNIDVAAGMLRKYNMEVDCVDNGKEAVSRIVLQEPIYNAIFMDHMMPEMDGIEATKLIRALGTEYAEKLPIIALTANAIAGSEQMFLDNGFNAFLAKPFSVMSLDAIIQLWVRDKSKEENHGE